MNPSTHTIVLILFAAVAITVIVAIATQST